MNTFNIALDLDKSVSRTPPTVRLRQGDQDGTVIAATIYDHGAALGQRKISQRMDEGQAKTDTRAFRH